MREPRIGVLVVAYNATATLARTLQRIPVDFRPRISEVFARNLERRLAGLPDATQEKAIPAASLLRAVIAERIKNALARLLEKFRR